MGWKQGPTSIQVEKSTAVGIATKESHQKKSKAIDMRFYWINDRIEKGKFWVFWIPVPENLGDYHPKYHPPEHNISVCSKYLYVPNLRSLQGCVNLTIRVNPTKLESRRAQLERYFLGCISGTLPLNSAQSNARRACGIADTQPVTANGIARTRIAEKHQITTKHIALPILQVSSLIINNIFNTDDRRQWRYK